MDTMTKLTILADAAKYDVACTSSGVNRPARTGFLGSAGTAGCCHSFTADGRCISLLKVLLTNVCTCDCAYCINRRSNDIPRACFTPRELAELTVAFYRRNYIEGLFLSSGVLRNPDYTMEQLIETVRILREEERFNGYVHVKTIPGSSPELVQRLGLLADRLSVNIELPSQSSLNLLAPEKGRSGIIKPMRLISEGIAQNREDRRLARRNYLRAVPARFAPAGQSTQLIVGATPETDQHILYLTSALYQKFSLKRVFYSAYLPINDSPLLPSLHAEVPLTREHRLYQADWLLRFYGFEVSELLPSGQPDLSLSLDPKAAWALRNLDRFPVEVNSAEYEDLLRVPGLGVRCAKRVVRARRAHRLGFDDLKNLGVSLKRAGWFITCNGRMADGFRADARAARASMEQSTRTSGTGRKGKRNLTQGQLSLFEAPSPHASDPMARIDARDRLLAAARSQPLRATVNTPDELPSTDPLLTEVAS